MVGGANLKLFHPEGSDTRDLREAEALLGELVA